MKKRGKIESEDDGIIRIKLHVRPQDGKRLRDK